MYSFLLVALGGAIGSVMRYGIAVGMARAVPDAAFTGTLIINVIGSGLLGLFTGWIMTLDTSRSLLFLFVATGICGGFTTFSTFSREVIEMIMQGAVAAAAMYVALSVAGSLGAMFGGLMFARRIFT